MNIEFDVTLQCNFSCVNCNRHSNFNDLSSPLTGGKSNKVGLDYYENTNITIEKTKKFIWTFSSYDTNDEVFSDRNVMPVGCVLKMTKLVL